MHRRFFKHPVVLCVLISATAWCGSFELRFSAVIQNDANDVFGDSFSVFGSSTHLPDDMTASLLYHPPAPPAGNYLQIYHADGIRDYSRDSRVFDPNVPDLHYSMLLRAFDAQWEGVSGQCVIELINPSALQQIPPDCLVYIRRFDSQGAFIQSYDLSDPENYRFEWPISGVEGLFAQLDFLIIDRCLAANLMMNDRIDLADYAVLARNWDQNSGYIGGDIYLDAVVDMKDLAILAEKWLCSCQE